MRLYIIIPIMLTVTACTVGPNFVRPQLDIPAEFTNTLQTEKTADYRDSCWWTGFGDDNLNSLISLALENNKDYELAIITLQKANLTYRNARAALFPSLSLDVTAEATYDYTDKIIQEYGASPTISWEVDLFGGKRRSRESAAALLGAAEWNKRSVRLSVISSVATTYFSLLEYNALREIAIKSYNSRCQSYNLMLKKFDYGYISQVSLDQSQSLMLSAKISVDTYTKAISETSSALSTLLGVNPKKFNLSSKELFALHTPSAPSTIMPLWAIENRPDIQEAYYNLWSSSAQIGVAVSKRFPTVSLSADGGVLYEIESDFTTSVPYVWGGTLSIAQSIFNFGVNKRNVKIARLNNSAELISLEKSVITALGEVEKSIVAVNSLLSQVESYKKLIDSNIRINDMTNMLYSRGATDYLNVLDAERSLFSAQTSYISTLAATMQAYVDLFKAIGGIYPC